MITDNIRRVRDDIRETALNVGRDPDDITLLAVTKTRSVEEIREAVAAGIVHFGENRVQEAASKIPEVREGITWHLVGHLQSNKARKAVELFDRVDSVDSGKLVTRLSHEAVRAGRKLPVLVQVNISGEGSKSGIPPEKTWELATAVDAAEGLELKGLMTIGSLGAEPEVTRAEFKRMRGLFDEIRIDEIGYGMDVLSMGMTGDYRIAIEEGATMIRIGTALFQ